MTAIPSKGEIEVALGGQKRKLQFTIGDFEECEANLNVGMGELSRRLVEGYRLTDVRTIIEIALKRAGWKAEPSVAGKPATMLEEREQVLEMIRVEGPATHVRTCIRLFNAALADMPGNAAAPAGTNEATASNNSLSGASLNSAE